MLVIRQTWTLIWKNILIVLIRHAFTTPLRAFLMPIIFTGFLAYARNLFIPPSHFGIGSAVPVKGFEDALRAVGAGRDTVAFVNNGHTNGDIAKIIDQFAETVRHSGKYVQILSNETELQTTCRSSIRGVSRCIGAAVFYSSPSEGSGGRWNYTLRVDGGLGTKIDVTNSHNDAELYILPFQHALDFAIARQNQTIDQAALPAEIYEYPFTSRSEAQRQAHLRITYMGGIIDVLAVAFFIAIVGVIYQLVGLMASERELGMTQIIEASMPNTKRWQTQAIRFTAYHLAFDAMFLPGWIGIGLIQGLGVFQKSSLALMVLFNILSGLSLSSFSLFGAAFFHKAQLSGIVTTILSLLLGVLAQVLVNANLGAVIVLSFLFPPMTYVFFIILVARWERQNLATNLLEAAPQNSWILPGLVLVVFLVLQTLLYPLIAARLERSLYGTYSKGRESPNVQSQAAAAVTLSDFTKLYRPQWWHRFVPSKFLKSKDTVTAVDGLNLSIPQGQIMVLLGANGSGKSTTLEAIAGLNTITSGKVVVDGRGGLGICPQRNVLWDQLSAYEHVKIFNRLKAVDLVASKQELMSLIRDCDLDRKTHAKARHLSGGQKRKLQLAMMFTGGSRVCCVDECSSGVDALARQKLWNILLNERGKRTIIFTTHFLDEADLLSDQIAILSKGCLKASGSAVELKHRLGGGTRLIVYRAPGETLKIPALQGFHSKETVDRLVFTIPDPSQVMPCIEKLEQAGVRNYEISSPTIEEIFFSVAESDASISRPSNRNRSLTLVTGSDNISEVSKAGINPATEEKTDPVHNHRDILQLQTGKRLGILQQAWVLFRKRVTILRRNYLPSVAALLIPIVAAGLVTLFLKGFSATQCAPSKMFDASTINSLINQVKFNVPVGPVNRLSLNSLSLIQSAIPSKYLSSKPSGENATFVTSINSTISEINFLINSVHPIQGSLRSFDDYIEAHYDTVVPGGVFLGDRHDPPTFAYKANTDLYEAFLTQNLMDTLITNISISSQYQAFDIPTIAGIGKTLQLIIYFGLAMSAFPAFFALYPTLERLRHVRQLHYSNGVRASTLWLAYLSFDFIIVLIGSILAVIIFRAVSDAWYHVEYLFAVLFLYGMASTLLAYVISLFSSSQLAAFAFAAGGQAVMSLLYFIAYLSVLTYVPVNKVDQSLLITHFTIALITPAGNLIRAMFVALNVFSTACEGHTELPSYPGSITLYGGPIVYLLVQSIVLYGILVWWDSSSFLVLPWNRRFRPQDVEELLPIGTDVQAETDRVANSNDGLRVQHVTKSYGRNTAVQDLTFGVKQGEVFALLGPNGAGKSTTISLIRGDLAASPNSGDISVEGTSMSKHRALARTNLGVCPQVDACDQMTVSEHLQFYARVRGVANVEHNVSTVILAVGLQEYQHRMAAKLSGGNKRKLSLAIALMGNPSVLLLDEPSSGMDVCAKRVMWRTLMSVLPGRSLVLTTHSMEEADALADRAGIMGKKMLAVGTSNELRRRFGDRCHVHLIMRSAPHTSEDDMDQVKAWITQNLSDAQIEQKTWHGQLRFSVPVFTTSKFSRRPPSPAICRRDSEKVTPSTADGRADDTKETTLSSNANGLSSTAPEDEDQSIGILFRLLEANKAHLGFEYYSVSRTTLDQVFLAIVKQHNIEEENYATSPNRKASARWRKICGSS